MPLVIGVMNLTGGQMAPILSYNPTHLSLKSVTSHPYAASRSFFHEIRSTFSRNSLVVARRLIYVFDSIKRCKNKPR